MKVRDPLKILQDLDPEYPLVISIFMGDDTLNGVVADDSVEVQVKGGQYVEVIAR